MREHPGVAPTALALLAGGRSRRMGHDKARADFAGATLIEWLLERVAPAFPSVFVVAKDVARFRDLGVPVVADARAVESPTVGVYTAVAASPSPRTLCLGCDIPFVTTALLLELAQRPDSFDAVVPRDVGGLQPLCAVYSRRTLAALEQMLDADERRIDLIFERVHTDYVDLADGRFGDPRELFLNVNTPSDLEAARRLAAHSARGPKGDPDAVAVPVAAAVAGVAPPAAHLAPEVLDFIARAPLPTVSVMGKKKSGKTTVLVGVIEELARRGRRVAVVKHDMHGFELDVAGTDTDRLRRAGAVVTAISSPFDVAVMSAVGEDLPLLSLLERIHEPVDLVLTEGFARQPAPKIEVSRAARSGTLISRPDQLLGIVSDQPFADYPVPQFGLNEYTGLADLLESFLARPGRR
jgi:molybdopterin-guanine dinucleotide biosynthesis protein MobB